MTHWINLDNLWLEETCCTIETDFYTKLYKNIMDGERMETYQIFLVPMGNTKIIDKIYLQARNDSVTPNTRK